VYLVGWEAEKGEEGRGVGERTKERLVQVSFSITLWRKLQARLPREQMNACRSGM
jgi:hypothetical protein